MPTENQYKIIIIGAGITGLSTGLAWTKIYNADKNPVIILEKQPVVGGCIATFARKGYRFDTVQIIPDVSDVLDFFNIDIELRQFKTYYARLFLANTETGRVDIYPIQAGLQKFKEYLTEHFPGDKKHINDFFEYCNSMYTELQYLKTEPSFWQLFGILIHCRKILSNSNKTYKQFLNRFNFSSPVLREILNTFSSFSGLSADRCASLLTVCAMITTLRGSYRPVKGFIQFPLSLKKSFEENGGKIRLNTEVKRILTSEGKATGVELTDGTILRSDIVVTTADTKVSLGKLIGYDILKKVNRKYGLKAEKAVMSASAINIHLGLDDDLNLKDMGFDCGYNVLTTGKMAHEHIFKAWERDELLLSDDCFHMAVISPSVQTGGKPNLIIRVVPVPANKWIDLRRHHYEKYIVEKNNIAAFYIDKVEQYMIPGLKQHIRQIDISTPATYERYIGSPTGSNYDMLSVPQNFGKNRLKSRTPVKNLFLPKFSHGIWPCMQAGLQVVDMISGGKIMNGNSSYSSPGQ